MTTPGDAIFPLAGMLDVLRVHDLLIHSQGASVTVGVGRKWRNAAVTVTPIRGYVCAPNPAEVRRAAALGVTVDAVARLAIGTVIVENDELEAPDPPPHGGAVIAAVLVGRYAIHSVRPNPADVRVLLSRVRGEAAAHAG